VTPKSSDPWPFARQHASSRRSRFVWGPDDLEFLTADEAAKALGYEGAEAETFAVAAEADKRAADMDELVSEAVTEAANKIVLAAGESFHERTLESAVLAAIQKRMGTAVAGVRKTFQIPQWQPQPGGVDVFVTQDDAIIAALELKIDDVDQSLWDIYKMAALASSPTLKGCYVAVAAKRARWASGKYCTKLFVHAPTIFDSARVFEEESESWKWLLREGVARPQSVPRRLRIVPVAAATIAARPEYDIRAIRVHGALRDGRLLFRNDWPATSSSQRRGEE
jgi:hypothetical protein